MPEPTNSDLMPAINALTTAVGGLEIRMGGLESRMDRLKGAVERNGEAIVAVRVAAMERMDRMQSTIEQLRSEMTVNWAAAGHCHPSRPRSAGRTA